MIIASTVLAILICATLAACGAAEKKQNRSQSDDTGANVSADSTDTPTDPSEPMTEPSEELPTEPSDTMAPEPPQSQTEPAAPDEENTSNSESESVPPETEPETEPEPETDAKTAEKIVETATELLGTPYAYGGSSPEDGFDATGFVYYCLRAGGMDFPRQLKAQLEAGEKIEYGDLKSGDAVYFSEEPGGSATFCGVYVGGGLIVYAPVPGETVKTANITTNYWTTRFVTGIRPTDKI